MCVLVLFVSRVEAAQGEGKDVRIAIAQIFCLDGDRSGNLVRIENAIVEAKEKGAEMVCLPETSILGWVNPDAHQRACPIPGDDSDKLCGLARKHGVFLCVGLAEREDGKLYDSAILIDRDGRILLKHRKINVLKKLMTPPYTPGTGVKAVDTEFGRIGVLICADSFLETVLDQMKELKPDIVIIPYGWAHEEKYWPGHGKELAKTVQNAAKRIGCAVVGTNLVGEITHGPWTGLIYGGSSIASDKHGKTIGLCRDRDRDITVVLVR